MTTDALSEAGPALDLEIATRVFGLREGPDFDVARCEKTGQIWLANVPPYSTDIAAAYTVLAVVLAMPAPAPRKLWAQLRGMVVYRHASGPDALGAWLLCHNEHPLLICRAALAAVRAAGARDD